MIILLLEYKSQGKWRPSRILDEENIHQALDNLVVTQKEDWRVRRISREDVLWINAYINMLGS